MTHRPRIESSYGSLGVHDNPQHEHLRVRRYTSASPA
eukprot:CAMPEP_0119137056 /NCGR_PEP_ID=MMETSP1310-20130426/22778_1 /TAXON_ID=464262 /ORGANISM="Genus nov. species nov., Strain RCC2339" /LENGTH=36 /DNA_ID= /DNA_START= /DNA_END= /DNA_ORIENTATION=